MKLVIVIPIEGSKEAAQDKAKLYGAEIVSKTRVSVMGYGFAPAENDNVHLQGHVEVVDD